MQMESLSLIVTATRSDGQPLEGGDVEVTTSQRGAIYPIHSTGKTDKNGKFITSFSYKPPDQGTKGSDAISFTAKVMKDSIEATNGCNVWVGDQLPAIPPVENHSPELSEPKVKWDMNGHYYDVAKIGLNWEEAKSYAENQLFTDPNTGFVYKGHLATINSPEENSWIVKNLISPTNLAPVNPVNGEVVAVWLGGHKISESWFWITREPWTFANWYPGEPNNRDGIEGYLQMYTGGYKGDEWNDNSIDGRFTTDYALIEYEPSDVDLANASSTFAG